MTTHNIVSKWYLYSILWFCVGLLLTLYSTREVLRKVANIYILRGETPYTVVLLRDGLI